MGEEIKNLLEKEIKNQIENLASLEPGSEKHSMILGVRFYLYLAVKLLPSARSILSATAVTIMIPKPGSIIYSPGIMIRRSEDF